MKSLWSEQLLFVSGYLRYFGYWHEVHIDRDWVDHRVSCLKPSDEIMQAEIRRDKYLSRFDRSYELPVGIASIVLF